MWLTQETETCTTWRGDNTVRKYPNKLLAERGKFYLIHCCWAPQCWWVVVQEFRVKVYDSDIIHTFTLHTNIGWPEFKGIASNHFKVGEHVHLGYHISSRICKMMELITMFQWDDTMVQMQERCEGVWNCAVTMDIINMVVSDHYQC